MELIGSLFGQQITEPQRLRGVGGDYHLVRIGHRVTGRGAVFIGRGGHVGGAQVYQILLRNGDDLEPDRDRGAIRAPGGQGRRAVDRGDDRPLQLAEVPLHVKHGLGVRYLGRVDLVDGIASGQAGEKTHWSRIGVCGRTVNGQRNERRSH